MSKTQGKAAPAANVPADTKAGPVTLTVKDAAILEHAQRLTLATEGEAKVREEAARTLDTATATTFGTLRDSMVATLKELGPANAKLVLDVYLSGAKLVGGILKSRASQYASDLNRMVKAATAGKELPAELLTCGRSAYLEHAFWKDSGVLVSKGTKGKAKTAAGAANNAARASQATEAAKEMAADAVAQAAADANKDKGMAKIASLIAQLHGPFRAEAYVEVPELLIRILKKQAAASGTGQH